MIKMNKIIDACVKFFKGFYFLIDRYIVTPISKLVYLIGKKIGKNGGKLEKLLNRPSVLLYFSLALAVIAFFLVDSKVISLVETEAEILVNKDVVIEYNKEAYVVEGAPELVDITLIGRKSDLYLAKQLGEHEVVLDLTDYTPREEPYKVKLTYNQTIDNLSYKLDPTYVYVTISKKVSSLKTITYDLLNQDELDGTLSVKDVSLDKTEVVVKGSEETLNRIATVKALIDLSNDKFTDSGTYTLDNVPIVAYDEEGKILDNVEIVPVTVSATIELSSYSVEVPIKILTVGDLVAGKAISKITINGETDYRVTIYGDQSDLESITSVPVTIDVTGQGNNGNKTYNVMISKPSGVRYISDKSATVKVEFGEAVQKTIEDVQIQFRNVPSGLTVNAQSTEDKYVDVQVIGVESVIDKLSEDNLYVYIDLNGYTAGNHNNVKVYVEGDDPKVTYLVNSTVNITITKN